MSPVFAMGRSSPGGIGRIRTALSRLMALTCIVVVAGLACQSAAPPIPTIPPLTAPPPATPTTTPPAVAQAQPAQPSETVTTTSTNRAISDAALARTAEQTVDLTKRMLQPRHVDADFLWGSFITNRSFVGGWGRTPDPDYTTRMLEMWRQANPCYSALEAEIAKLNGGNSLPPLEFVLYTDHVVSQLSPCVDEQLSSIDGKRFFDNSPNVRAQRITTWFDHTWQDANDGTFPFDAGCRDGFYSHLPVAIAASESHDLESAWASAMVVVSQCARAAMQDYFAFLDITESRLFNLTDEDRYTAVNLQMTMVGHLISIDARKPHAECWPEYATLIPRAAAADTLDKFSAAKDDAFRSLYACLEALPPYNPFAGQ